MSGGKTSSNERLKGLGHYRDLLCAVVRRYASDPRQLRRDLAARRARRAAAAREYFNGFRQTRCRRIVRGLFEWPTHSQALVVMAALFSLLFVTEVLDPFGLSHSAQSHSESLFQKVSSVFYGQTEQERTAVVLIDEQSLKRQGESWPPRYVFYDELVRRIARQQPAAIFLDVLVEDKRPYDETLDEARRGLQRSLEQYGVPLYLGALDEGKNSVFADVPGVRHTLVGWSGYGQDYPLLVGEGHFYDDGAAVHGSQGEEGEECPAHPHPTAAFSLYRQLCADGAQGNCPAALAEGDTEAFCKPLVVQWGREVSAQVSERELISTSQCRARDTSLWGSLREFVRTSLATLSLGVDEGAERQLRQPCPYTVTVRAEDLGSEKVRGLLKDRVVMIGLSLKGIHDEVESPVHGQVPGVYLHAMALDNLLKWNDGYYQRKESHELALLLAWCVVLICVAILRSGSPRESFLMRAVALAAIAGTCLYSYLVQHRPPVDWLGLMVVYELVNRLIEKNELHHSQGGARHELEPTH